MRKIIIPAVAILLLATVVFVYLQNRKRIVKDFPAAEKTTRKDVENDKTDENQAGRGSLENPTVSSSESDLKNIQSGQKEKGIRKIRVLDPKEYEIVKSPLEIKGEASGWYFEGIFPVRIEDESGNILGKSNASAQGEWMTEDFVPFIAKLRFDPGEAEKGKIIFEKDNPSGNPELDEYYELPIKFKETEGEKLL